MQIYHPRATFHISYSTPCFSLSTQYRRIFSEFSQRRARVSMNSKANCACKQRLPRRRRMMTKFGRRRFGRIRV